MAQVKGKAKYSEAKGVRTRRQVAAQGATATYPPVALPVKLMHVLVQLLTEADDAAAAGGDDWRAMLFADECEWESDEEDNDEEGGDASTAGNDTVAAETVVRFRTRCCSFCDCSDTVAVAGGWGRLVRLAGALIYTWRSPHDSAALVAVTIGISHLDRNNIHNRHALLPRAQCLPLRLRHTGLRCLARQTQPLSPSSASPLTVASCAQTDLAHSRQRTHGAGVSTAMRSPQPQPLTLMRRQTCSRHCM